MLVKLGNSWFSVEKVERIKPSIPPFECALPTGKKYHYVCVRTFDCSDTTVKYVDTPEEAEKLADDYAAIINNALNTQSFGGETNEEAPEVA